MEVFFKKGIVWGYLNVVLNGSILVNLGFYFVLKFMIMFIENYGYFRVCFYVKVEFIE